MALLDILSDEDFIDIFNSPHIVQGFSIKFPNRDQELSVNLKKVKGFCEELLLGTFLFERFDPSWLIYRKITTKDLINFVNNYEFLKDIIRKAIGRFLRDASEPRDLVHFFYNPATQRSAFLLYAKLILDGINLSVFVEKNIEQTTVKNAEFYIATGESLYGILFEISSWYLENQTNIKLINRNTIALSNIGNLSNFIEHYLEKIVKMYGTITHANSRIGSKAWWEFVKEERQDFGVNLDFSKEDVADAKAISELGNRKSSGVYPRDFHFWPIDRQFEWRYANDLDFKKYIDKIDSFKKSIDKSINGC